MPSMKLWNTSDALNYTLHFQVLSNNAKIIFTFNFVVRDLDSVTNFDWFEHV